MAKPVCVECGGPADTPLTVAVHGGGGRSVVCGTACRDAHHRAGSKRKRCAGYGCRRWLTPAATGRPATFCSDACRKGTDRVLGRAAVLVAKGRVPRRAQSCRVALDQVQFLVCCLRGQAAAREYGRPFPSVEAPAPEFVTAAYRMVTRLSQGLADREREEAHAAREQRANQAAAEAARIRAAGTARENAWRLQVLDGYAAEAAELDELGVY